MDILFSDPSLGILFLTLSILLMVLMFVLIVKRNNWFWALGGFIPMLGISLAAFTHQLDASYRLLLFALLIFSFLHAGWNLVVNLSSKRK